MRVFLDAVDESGQSAELGMSDARHDLHVVVKVQVADDVGVGVSWLHDVLPDFLLGMDLI